MGLDFILLAAMKYLSHYGYFGLFAGCFLSSLFIPLGSDLLFIGMLAAGANPWLCLFIATTGNWVGGLVIYAISYAGNTHKIQKWFHIKKEQLEKQKAKVEKYGSLLALIVWIPVIGDVSTVALGFYRTNKFRTFVFMYIGRMCRFFLWVILYLIYANRFVKFIDRL